MLSDDEILERGGTQEDINSYAHDVGGACSLGWGDCDQCHPDRRLGVSGIDKALDWHLDLVVQESLSQLMSGNTKIEITDKMVYGAKSKAKQAILEWHNKQIEEAMAKFHLKKGVAYDVKASDSMIVITPTNKLKESK